MTTILAVATRAFLLIAAAAGVAAAVVRSMRFDSLAEPRAAAILGAGLLVGIALACVALLASRTLVKRLIIEFSMLVAVLLTAEIVVTAAKPEVWAANPGVRKDFRRHAAAERLGLPFDKRSISQVVEDLRAQGIDAQPGVGRGWVADERVDEHLPAGFYPLSHVSNATIVECNESGEYLVYRTDEFGFNNPPGLIASRQISIAIVGDSTAVGHCVRPGESVADEVRKTYPGTANFSMADTRTVAQLATFREYVEPLRPAVVVWFVDPGYALMDDERHNAKLLRYFDPAFSQGLLSRQGETDEAIRRLALPLQAEVDGLIAAEVQRASAERFAHVLTLPQMRRSLDLLSKWRSPAAQAPDLDLFKQSLLLVQQTVASWDGKLVVLILPNFGEVVGELPEGVRRRAVAAIVQEAGISMVDSMELFLSTPDPTALFALRMDNHPNEEGHALLASGIVEELARSSELSVALTVSTEVQP